MVVTMDPLSPAARSALMSRIRSTNSRGECALRSLLHRAGFRFRLHRRDLPGTPDIVLPKYSAVVFMHGCFWHQHPGCRSARIPHTNTDFWARKLNANVVRFERQRKALRDAGWRVFVVWECELRQPELVERRLVRQLKSDGKHDTKRSRPSS
ncbi:DNA mismatch endonuclease Vsr [Burkholderia sp.]|uniref:very short patch repair endonuclease n=1 Tax=Burkholderia sp. TaxID=36773 RepID=UPI0034572BBC